MFLQRSTVVEREIERAVVEHQARTGAAIVMDPHTGEILAMTNWPLFDPNVFRSSQASDWRNRTVADMWEPGSTFKVFTYAAALETGVLGPDTVLDCGDGRIQIGRYRIRDTHRNEELTAWQVIEQSSNIGTYRMAAMTGEEQLFHYIEEFGFGQRTGIGLGGESSGLIAHEACTIHVPPTSMNLRFFSKVFETGGRFLVQILWKCLRYFLRLENTLESQIKKKGLRWCTKDSPS